MGLKTAIPGKKESGPHFHNAVRISGLTNSRYIKYVFDAKIQKIVKESGTNRVYVIECISKQNHPPFFFSRTIPKKYATRKFPGRPLCFRIVPTTFHPSNIGQWPLISQLRPESGRFHTYCCIGNRTIPNFRACCRSLFRFCG